MSPRGLQFKFAMSLLTAFKAKEWPVLLRGTLVAVDSFASNNIALAKGYHRQEQETWRTQELLPSMLTDKRGSLEYSRIFPTLPGSPA